MAEHYTMNTTGVLKYCNTCKRKTIHSISGKRIGYCNEHTPNLLTKDQERQQKRSEEYNRNLGLFD